MGKFLLTWVKNRKKQHSRWSLTEYECVKPVWKMECVSERERKSKRKLHSDKEKWLTAGWHSKKNTDRTASTPYAHFVFQISLCRMKCVRLLLSIPQKYMMNLSCCCTVQIYMCKLKWRWFFFSGQKNINHNQLLFPGTCSLTETKYHSRSAKHLA